MKALGRIIALVLLLAMHVAWEQEKIAQAAPERTPGVVTDEDRRFWSFCPLHRPAVPQVVTSARVNTPIDAFLLKRLEAASLTFAPEADRPTLARRLYLDLVGLPPSPADVQAFVMDPAPDAFENLVDRLLASPHFGERWGRHWLDNAGYVDVMGGDNDLGTTKLAENKWRYRDYVIRAFNEDRPFDRFLTEQLAGDELVDWRAAPVLTPELRELLTATGFLRVAADDTDENELNTLDIRHGVLQRTGETVASNLLGLTIQCAKCHDHKFEPLTQRDYYQLLACLTPAFNTQAWLQPKQRALPAVSPAEKAVIEAANAEVQRKVDGFTKRKTELQAPTEEKLRAAKLLTLPEAVRADTKLAVETPAEKRDDVQKYLVGKLGPLLKVTPDELTAALPPTEKEAVATLDREIAATNAKRRTWEHLQAVYDTGPPPATHVLKRGNYLAPGAEVPPGIPGVLATSPLAASRIPNSSGRRLALAQRLTDWDSPAGALVLRVRVNRIWQQLFGKGLVTTADNLGVTGAAPTHPELLEWLTAEYAAHRQLKPLLRLLVTSSAYRQASARPDAEAAMKNDPDNRLLWRMPLRRLESEVVRDTLLALGGNLHVTMGGPPVTDQPRRSLYLVARRNYHPTLLAVFDQPILSTNCTGRQSSAVVLQSLTMLHDDLVLRQADLLAGRVACGEHERETELVFQLVLGRQPSATETASCAAMLERQTESLKKANVPAEQAARQALTQLCHTLLCTSEFLYAP